MHIKVCRVLNQFDHFLISGSAFSVFFSISAFASLAGISIESCSRIKNLCNNCKKLEIMCQLSRKRGKSVIK